MAVRILIFSDIVHSNYGFTRSAFDSTVLELTLVIIIGDVQDGCHNVESL